MKQYIISAFAMFVLATGLTGCGPEKADITTMNKNSTTAAQNCEKTLSAWAAAKFPAPQKVVVKCDIDSDVSATFQVNGDVVSSPIGDAFATGHLTVDGVAQPDLSVFTLEPSDIVLSKGERSQKTIYTNRAETVQMYIEQNGIVLKKI